MRPTRCSTAPYDLVRSAAFRAVAYPGSSGLAASATQWSASRGRSRMAERRSLFHKVPRRPGRSRASGPRACPHGRRADRRDQSGLTVRETQHDPVTCLPLEDVRAELIEAGHETLACRAAVSAKKTVKAILRSLVERQKRREGRSGFRSATRVGEPDRAASGLFHGRPRRVDGVVSRGRAVESRGRWSIGGRESRLVGSARSRPRTNDDSRPTTTPSRASDT